MIWTWLIEFISYEDNHYVMKIIVILIINRTLETILKALESKADGIEN